MIQIPVENVDSLIMGLLKTEFFDSLEMIRLELTTSVTRSVDGRIHRDFYDSEEDLPGEYILWKDEKTRFFDAMRGKVLPLQFWIVFRYPKKESDQLFGRDTAGTSLYLNVSYDRKNTFLTTGIAQNSFPQDMSFGREWDDFVQSVMQKLEIS